MTPLDAPLSPPVSLTPPPRRSGKRTRRVRGIIFLKDVAGLACTAFGGPQAHLAMMFRLLVEKRRYLSAAELLELQALCQLLPGPTSTQTITVIGFRLGGPTLAYLTLLVWATPATLLMTLAALTLSHLDPARLAALVQFVQPVAVGFVAFSAYRISEKVIHTKTSVGLTVAAAMLAYFFQLPWVLPVLLVAGGALTTVRYRRHAIEPEKKPLRIEWANFGLWLGILLGAALLGHYTRILPVRLFENFYRNGSLVFGGGQVLAPLLYAEFVEFKQYLTGPEFLSGLGLVQAMPGPNFSLAAYIGALAMRPVGGGPRRAGAGGAGGGGGHLSARYAAHLLRHPLLGPPAPIPRRKSFIGRHQRRERRAGVRRHAAALPPAARPRPAAALRPAPGPRGYRAAEPAAGGPHVSAAALGAGAERGDGSGGPGGGLDGGVGCSAKRSLARGRGGATGC